MSWFSKKPDPISERAQTLNDEIAQLEAEIKRLDALAQRNNDQPRLRSTAIPRGATLEHSLVEEHEPPAPAAPQEPIFEEVDRDQLKPATEPATTPEHFNELGVRKYDLPAFFSRLGNHFRGPSTTNPKLVSYLAAGGIQGLRPLRYEKRVARNRFIFLVAALFFILFGILAVAFHHR